MARTEISNADLVWIFTEKLKPFRDCAPRQFQLQSCQVKMAGPRSMPSAGRGEMPIVQEGPLRAAGAHDQADRDGGNHAVSVGASGRGAVRGLSAVSRKPSPISTRWRLFRDDAS
jgi:hypothetical protein